MNTTFAALKKNRKSNFDKLNEELAKASGKVEYKNDDDRFWYPAVDKVGNGYAVIRFLPAPNGEDVPFVRVFEHSFQGPTGSWYIEKSLTTLGQQDPVSEYNSKLWNSGLEADKDKARKQKRKLTFISNIYVVSDPANPENEGKVKLYKYGKKIFDKLFEANNPKFPDEKPIDPFDLWGGANLKLKIRNVEGYRNYDASVFDTAGPLFTNDKDDKKGQAVWNQENSLQEFIDTKNFKPYDELKTKFNRVLGLDGNHLGGNESNVGWKAPPDEKPKKAKSAAPKEEAEVEPDIDSEDGEDIEFFRNIANEDTDELIS